jgi:hypothetical protein
MLSFGESEDREGRVLHLEPYARDRAGPQIRPGEKWRLFSSHQVSSSKPVPGVTAYEHEHMLITLQQANS